ncbi:MAG: bifunctional methylenetetrahydrofolate dehydrogenase/methenyltetrahydrofolate cyclohydrolase, partial [Acidiphilium sp. 21-68-69]
MAARIIDGKAVAASLRAEVAARAAALRYAPGLVVVLVGADPASQVYVRNKERAAAAAGIAGETIRLPATTSQAELLAVIDRLNRDGAVDGILVQLPLPAGLDAGAVIRAIDPAKDVDGFHPDNVAALALGVPFLVPCTPRGVMKLIDASGIAPRGARAVVLGRSNIVGRPMAALLLAADATVTIAHSRTRDLAAE